MVAPVRLYMLGPRRPVAECAATAGE